MKVHILYKTRPDPYGGGNQFLKALKNEFVKIKTYSDKPWSADVILVNSHHFLEEAIGLKRLAKIFVHRIDGPVFDVRGQDRTTDKIIFKFNELFSDGTIFQSNWSREKCYLRGLGKLKYETVIINAPDSDIFNAKEKAEFKTNRKIKLIATSWSPNWRRGFDIYKFLDDNLNFSMYEMIFAGNSPIKFRNIKHINPLPSAELADFLRESDIFITASQHDPCSNSLIEALHCGLPVVARNSGGHPEIIGKAGELFNSSEDVILAINRVVSNYERYQSSFNLPTIKEVAKRYYQFMEMVYNEKQNEQYEPKKATLQKRIQFLGLKMKIKFNKLKTKVINR